MAPTSVRRCAGVPVDVRLRTLRGGPVCIGGTERAAPAAGRALQGGTQACGRGAEDVHAGPRVASLADVPRDGRTRRVDRRRWRPGQPSRTSRAPASAARERPRRRSPRCSPRRRAPRDRGRDRPGEVDDRLAHQAPRVEGTRDYIGRRAIVATLGGAGRDALQVLIDEAGTANDGSSRRTSPADLRRSRTTG